MANRQNFLDNLKNLGMVMSVALEHTRDNLDQFRTNGTLDQVRQAEWLVTKILTLAAQLEKEFDVLETSIDKAEFIRSYAPINQVSAGFLGSASSLCSGQ
ncbi:MAG: hypothetical protein JWO71_16 [Candidatus Acidoferrum typicum]|nr:hypothetical protein [Candidatus Acidoferrum typicum]